jgi:hypothetical protein
LILSAYGRNLRAIVIGYGGLWRREVLTMATFFDDTLLAIFVVCFLRHFDKGFGSG